MLCGRYPIRVSLVADTSHILEVSRKDNMDATMAIKGELEGVVFVAAGNDIFPVTRVGDSEADWVGDIVKVAARAGSVNAKANMTAASGGKAMKSHRRQECRVVCWFFILFLL